MMEVTNSYQTTIFAWIWSNIIS